MSQRLHKFGTGGKTQIPDEQWSMFRKHLGVSDYDRAPGSIERQGEQKALEISFLGRLSVREADVVSDL